MGFLKRKAHKDGAEDEDTSPLDVGETATSRAFYEAMQRGDLDAGSAILRNELSGSGTSEAQSLFDRALRVYGAVMADDLNKAATDLRAWHSPYADDYQVPQQRARMNALGLLLIRYFEHPAAGAHTAFDDLLEGQLRDLGKEAQRGGEPYFGDFFASTISARAMSRR